MQIELEEKEVQLIAGFLGTYGVYNQVKGLIDKLEYQFNIQTGLVDPLIVETTTPLVTE